MKAALTFWLKGLTQSNTASLRRRPCPLHLPVAPLHEGSRSRPCGSRKFSRNAVKPTLKQRLRELYKKVHPDLFHSHPEAKESNGRSLQLLQEYLDSAKQGGELGRTAGVPFRFSFFLHPTQADSPEASQQASPAGDLTHVSITLPPPARLDVPSASPDQLPRATHLAIGKLLAACGLSDNFEGVEELSASRLLRHFIPAAAEEARQRALQQAAPHSQIGMMRTALRMSRQASVGFGPALRQAGAAQQLEQVQKLTQALDRAAHLDVTGLHFMVEPHPGQQIDAWGHLWLDSTASSLSWSGALLQARLEDCRERQAAARQLERLEVNVASGIGVAMIYAAPSVALDAAYPALLQALAHVGQRQGPVEGDGIGNVPLCISPAAADFLAAFETDERLGLIRVPINSDAYGIYRYLQDQGPVLSAALMRKRQQDEDLEIVRSAAERRLRLRRLARDPALSAARFRAACLRMMASQGLSRVLEGLCVRISFANQVAPAGDVINVAWDFEV